MSRYLKAFFSILLLVLIQHALAQDENDLQQRRRLVEQKYKLVEMLVNSPAARKAGDAAAEQERAKLADARKALEAEQFDQALQILDQSLRALIKLGGTGGGSQMAESAQKKQFEEFREQVATYRKSIQELESNKSRGKAASLLLARVDAVAGEAEKLAKAGRIGEASKRMGDAYKMSVEELSQLRAGQEVILSLKFDTPADEYAYEQRRYQSNEILINNLLSEGKLYGDRRRVIDGFIEQAAQLVADAQAKATRKEHGEAVRTMEKAGALQMKALQALGVPVF
jgi:hypothetical protein